AASFNGPISYTDLNSLTVGTVSDGFSGMSSSGITSTNHDVKLTAEIGRTTCRAVALSSGNLTLSVTGNVTQGASGVLTAAGLQLMGCGTVHLDKGANVLTTPAASFNGPISYTDASALTVGTVSDGFSGMSTSGITSSNHDVKLTAGNDLTIGQAIALGSGNLTLVDTGNVTQGASGIITAAGLQLMGAGSAHLDNSANDITTMAASFSGAISYTDACALTVGTVSDTFSGMSTSGITSTNHDVKLTAAANLPSVPARRPSDLNLTLVDTGNVTQGASGIITAAGLQLMGAGSAHLDNST